MNKNDEFNPDKNAKVPTLQENISSAFYGIFWKKVHFIQCFLRYILEVHFIQFFLKYIFWKKVHFIQCFLRYNLEKGPFYPVLLKV